MGSVISLCHSTSWRTQLRRSSSRAVTAPSLALYFQCAAMPFFGDAMHLFGADLHFELMSAFAHHRGVQRLIAVGAGHGDEVLDAAGHRTPESVNQAEDGVTSAHILGDDANGQQVVDLIEGHLGALDLLDRWSKGA